MALHKLGTRACGPPHLKKLDAELVKALTFLRSNVANGVPLVLTAHTEKPMLIFTDGAFEAGDPASGSIGGILYDHIGRPLYFFSEKVPQILLDIFMQESDHPIYLIELLACFVAFRLWCPGRTGIYVVSYIDNEASRMALVRAYSSTGIGNVLVSMIVQLETVSQWKVWYGRVNSHSNPSDDPSRFVCDWLIAIGSERTCVHWDQLIVDFQKAHHDVVG